MTQIHNEAFAGVAPHVSGGGNPPTGVQGSVPAQSESTDASWWLTRSYFIAKSRRRFLTLRAALSSSRCFEQLIHYHGLPMTPTADMLRAMRGRHAMVSFEEPRQIEEAAEICQSVVLDNGIYSAWRAGRTHDFTGYASWSAFWLKHPAVDWCVIPDVIDGTEADNDELLNNWPLPSAVSVPVFHLHESLGRLARLSDGRYPRIALGSSGEFSEPGARSWWNRMAEIMRVLCDANGYPRVKIHGLRMLDPSLFSHLPLSSADSCNVARNIGIDQAWTGPYVPVSKWARAIVMMDRIEHHASARRWAAWSAGIQQNFELLG